MREAKQESWLFSRGSGSGSGRIGSPGSGKRLCLSGILLGVSLLSSRGSDGETTPTQWNEFLEGCRSGGGALSELDTIVSLHADTIARLVQLSDPELVVVSGAFNELGKIYLERLRNKVGEYLTDHYSPPPEVRFAFKSEYSGAHGAAALAAQNYRPAEN